MGHTREVYITGCGAYLPGEPVGNAGIAERLGGRDAGTAGRRERVLAANGIRQRYYAVGPGGEPEALNEELAAEAVGRALKDRGLAVEELGMLATGTTMGDLLVPGFAAMVHGRAGGGPMELLSAGGVCASGMAALKAAAAAVRLGEHDTAAVVGSELVSRVLTDRRFGAAGRSTPDADFLRWTLSDGAGAVLLQDRPRPDRTSLRVEWVRSVSHAHEHPVCMRAGEGWLDRPSAADAECDGLLRLRQDVRMLPELFRIGLADVRAHVDLGGIEHVLCHYSAERFRGEVFALLRREGIAVHEDRWFSNLRDCGNTGAASIFVMLEECWRTGRFRPGERVLLVVPESGRFTMSFALLTCVEPAETALLGELARVWAGLEAGLARVPLVRRIEDGTATLHDYRALLLGLRQQVVDGGRWIARAASNFSAELFELRSAAIRHAAEEHRDFLLLERDFAAVGGDPAAIRGAAKNAGSEALSAFVMQQASQPDPVDLLGAMFVIEGLGTVKALGWALRLREQLGLRDDQLSFLLYHADHDADHVERLQRLLRVVATDRAAAQRIVRTATIVARLYVLQLTEMTEEPA